MGPRARHQPAKCQMPCIGSGYSDAANDPRGGQPHQQRQGLTGIDASIAPPRCINIEYVIVRSGSACSKKIRVDGESSR